MPILTVSELTKTYGSEPVLHGVTFSVEPKEKVALVGRNGTGKTTLLRILAGQMDADRGSASLAPWAKAAYLAQIPEGSGDATAWEYVLTGAADVRALEARLRDLEALMARPEVHEDPVRLGAVMEEYGTVHDHFEHAGGFTLNARAGMVLSGLGFAEADRHKRLGMLSGGWRVRAELARVLLAEPDLQLLDEPTNHLDLEVMEWFEEYLRGFPGAVIIVSHDRYLIDAVTSRTLELEDCRVASFPGAYSVYTRLKTEQVERQRKVHERQREEVAKLERYIRRYKAGNRATQAKSREKMLARLEAAKVSQPRTPGVIRPKTTSAPASGRTVVRVRDAGKRYGDVEVFAGLTLEIYRGERIGLLGPNGTGKSTLLRLLAGIETPTSGSVVPGTGVRARYFAQEATEVLDPERTVLDEILGQRSMTPEQVRTYLGRFLFTGDDVFKQIGMLSGGERQRLNLAALLLEVPNLLLLDEPTNHLDIPSREALEAVLHDFPGTMVVATHDRYLLERLTTRILTIADRGVTVFRGSYHELRQRRAVQAPRAGSRARPQAESGSRSSARAARPEGPTFDEVAAQISAAERDLEDAGRWLADPELYRDPERVKEMKQRYQAAEARLEELYGLLAIVERGGVES